MSDKVKATAQKLVQYCREGKEIQGLDEYYAANVVSAEAMPMPGQDSNEIEGIDAIKAKHDWYHENFEIHEMNTSDPMMHGEDKFSVIFETDATNKMINARSRSTTVAVYTCSNDGKVTREEFFYNPE